MNDSKALVCYWSATGNTRKVAEAIHSRLDTEKVNSKLLKMQDAAGEDFLAYDLIFFGAPPYEFNAPDPVLRFIKEKLRFHRERGDVKLGAPKVPGKRVVLFCTYSGPHTAINEAVPLIKYMGQFFEHIGFEIAGEWYVVGEFHNREDASTKGRLGDIRGRPNDEDLARVGRDVSQLIKKIRVA